MSGDHQLVATLLSACVATLPRAPVGFRAGMSSGNFVPAPFDHFDLRSEANAFGGTASVPPYELRATSLKRHKREGDISSLAL